VAAAGELFAEQGVSATSLQSIADRLGVTKAAVYHQFASKEEIVTAVADPVIEVLRSIADEASELPAAAGRSRVIMGLVDLALAERGTSAIMRRDPSMAQVLDAYPPYLEQIARIDALLLGPDPTPSRRVALAFAGGGIMAIGAVAGLAESSDDVRTALAAAMARALDA
jgi:AcrR family transcriptional regulator